MRDLCKRAQEAQDRIGWASMPSGGDGGSDFAMGTLALARIVVELARRVEQLEATAAPAVHVEPPQYDVVECCASGSCEVCKR